MTQKIKSAVLNLKSFYKKHGPSIREFFNYAFSQGYVQVLSFLTAIYVYRYMGPTNLGLYNFSASFVAYSLLTIGALDFYFNIQFSKTDDEVEKQKLLADYFVKKIYVLILSALIISVPAYIFLPEDIFLYVCIIFLPTFLTSFSGFLFYAISHKRSKLLSFVQMISATLIISLKLFLVYTSQPLIHFIYVAALESTFPVISYIIYFYVYKDIRFLKYCKIISLKSFFRFLYEIRWSFLFLFGYLGLVKVDQFLIPVFKDAYSLGIYAAAVKVAEVPIVLAAVLNLIMTPRLKTILEDTKSGYKKLKDFSIFIILIGGVFSLIVSLFSKEIIGLLFGSKYLDSVNVLRVYIWSTVFYFFLSYQILIFGFLNKTRFMTLLFISSLALEVAFVVPALLLGNLALVALSSVFVYAFASFIFHINLKKSVKEYQDSLP